MTNHPGSSFCCKPTDLEDCLCQISTGRLRVVNQPDRAVSWQSVGLYRPKGPSFDPTVARYIFSACPVWSNTTPYLNNLYAHVVFFILLTCEYLLINNFRQSHDKGV